ncbi:hypothetical protein, partial [Komagataeibacter xylinus]
DKAPLAIEAVGRID